MTEEAKRAIEEEEVQKRFKSQADFHKTQTQLLKERQTYDPLTVAEPERRSKRVMRMTQQQFATIPIQNEQSKNMSKPSSKAFSAAQSREIRTGGFQKLG